MGVPVPSEVSDQELLNELSPRSRNVLCRVFNHFYIENPSDECDPEDYSQKGWRRLLAGVIPEETRQWLRTRDRLTEESVDRIHASAYLAESYEVPEEKRDPVTVYELAILVHELGLSDDLEELIVFSRIKQNEMKRSWTINNTVSLSNLSRNIESFHEVWNGKEEQSKAVLAEVETTGDSVACVKFTAEKGQEPVKEPTFGFRVSDSDEIPTTPQISTVEYRELKQIRMCVSVENGSTRIVFTSNHHMGWRRILSTFFDEVFDIDSVNEKLSKMEITEAESLQEEANESVELGDKPLEQIGELIDTRKTHAIEAIGDSAYGPTRKENLKSKVEGIELSGSEIEDDPNIGTQEFRLIGRTNLDGVFEHVDIEDSFLQFLKRASEESLALVLNVDGRDVAARSGGPQPIDGSRLGSEADLALRHFFDQEGVL